MLWHTKDFDINFIGSQTQNFFLYFGIINTLLAVYNFGFTYQAGCLDNVVLCLSVDVLKG